MRSCGELVPLFLRCVHCFIVVIVTVILIIRGEKKREVCTGYRGYREISERERERESL